MHGVSALNFRRKTAFERPKEKVCEARWTMRCLVSVSASVSAFVPGVKLEENIHVLLLGLLLANWWNDQQPNLA